MDEELDNKKWWIGAYNPALPTSTFGAASGVIYLSPFTLSGEHQFRTSPFGFKFDWVGSGIAYGFTHSNAIYRMERGTGGTASTWVKQFNIGTVQRIGGGPSTEYTNTTIATATPPVMKEGLYAIGWLWRDTSLPGSSVAWTVYGATVPSAGGWWYYAGGSGATTLPATIATVGAPSTFKIYFQQI